MGAAHLSAFETGLVDEVAGVWMIESEEVGLGRGDILEHTAGAGERERLSLGTLFGKVSGFLPKNFFVASLEDKLGRKDEFVGFLDNGVVVGKFHLGLSIGFFLAVVIEDCNLLDVVSDELILVVGVVVDGTTNGAGKAEEVLEAFKAFFDGIADEVVGNGARIGFDGGAGNFELTVFDATLEGADFDVIGAVFDD